MSVLSLGNGAAVSLGAVVAKAGEGTVYEVVGNPGWVAKIFHADLVELAAKLDKVSAMIATPPPGAVQDDGFVVLTWPLHLVGGVQGAVGYVMPRIDTANAVEIHSVSNPSNRANPLAGAPDWTLGVTWYHLVNVAANLCLAVEAVHRVDAVIGDFQERNILVANTTQVSLVDCDSMQFTDPGGGQFLCGVGRPEFTAPELADANLRTQARDTPSDLFALAVHVHLLLMAGNHPFMRGIWTGSGDQPDALSLATSGSWAGAAGSLLHTHPLAPPIAFLPSDIQNLFARAFTGGVHDPSVRPTATEWRTALLRIRVTQCHRGIHQIPVEADPCPWCVIDDERTTRKQYAKTAPAAPLRNQIIYPAHSPSSRFGATSVGPPSATSGGSGNTSRVVTGLGIVAVVAIALIAWIASTGSSETVSTQPAGSDTTAMKTGASTYAPTRTTPNNTPPPRVSPNSLNVSTPMSRPACDGTGIVVLGNATTPGRYDAEIQRLLNDAPGASYLRTDESCPSLRQSLDGKPIYAVYRVAGSTMAEVCAAVRAAGGDAYGKFLDNTSDPADYITVSTC